ncbi:glycosyltransferase [Sphingomicrobium aestuariivivum]|uniref:glycosyltransferase n=1 Tax=Sphingomicrobium aestuariivivum TaxID=1582356 RepID=UPI001FD6B5E3|nr:glycosyltransferase [Sphingomicrobium aestuariivivum]MCJ8191576.1 glycosyltransferase [Sphingomicrobium aestuariivivum]
MAKPVAERIRDGARNLWRHGRLRAPEFYLSRRQRAPRMSPALAAAAQEIRALRHRDAAAAGRLVDAHEAEFLAAGQDKFLAFAHFHAGRLERAAGLLDRIEAARLTDNEALLAGRVRSDWRSLEALREGRSPIPLAPRAVQGVAPEGPVRSLYLAATSLPFITSGYTSRSDALVRALLADARFDLHPATRPGFPEDRPDADPHAVAAETLFDRFDCTVDYRGDLHAYLDAALPRLVEAAGDRGHHLVHGVSNFRNGAIGLALARAIGLPFIYEVRGLWEETTDSKVAGWRNTERFEMERRFEQFLFAEAEGVLVINAQVRDTLAKGPRDNVRLLPNSIARERIRSTGDDADPGPPLRLGYIGSLVAYEGLDDVLDALAILAREGMDVRYDVYGDGKEREALEQRARALGLAEQVSFHGRVAPADVPTLYDRFDLCIFARKDRQVCRLVTPLKPIEAMANDTACLLSALPPLEDIASKEAALFCAPGEAASIAGAIARFAALTGPERARIRKAARSELAARFTWEAQCDVVADVYREAFAAGRAAPVSQPRVAG